MAAKRVKRAIHLSSCGFRAINNQDFAVNRDFAAHHAQKAEA
jgi:hypothetical protein